MDRISHSRTNSSSFPQPGTWDSTVTQCLSHSSIGSCSARNPERLLFTQHKASSKLGPSNVIPTFWVRISPLTTYARATWHVIILSDIHICYASIAKNTSSASLRASELCDTVLHLHE